MRKSIICNVFHKAMSGPLKEVEKIALQAMFERPTVPIAANQGCATLALLGLADFNLYDRTYTINEFGTAMAPINANQYFSVFGNVSERHGDRVFNRKFFTETMMNVHSLFSPSELLELQELDRDFQYHKRKTGPFQTEVQLRRAMYQFIWQSCELEGCSPANKDFFTDNKPEYQTHFLALQDELFDTACPKDRQDSISRVLTDLVMASNHLDALTFGHSPRQPRELLCKDTIIRVHSLLTSSLDQFPCNYTNSQPISPGVRDGVPVQVGSTYVPLATKLELIEGLDMALRVIHQQTDDYSQSVLTTVLLSYLQLFADGNKRTARLLGHAVLTNSNRFPVIYAAADADEYVNSLVLFYERTNLGAFKDLFLKTARRSVETYCNDSTA